ncbi:hypothetical protein L411_00307 [Escherichia coli BWH 24]|nr:hypothetical protein L411_00307 [Escherichia coli BWH 24]
MHPHRVRAENHPAGCGGAGSGAGADRPNQQLLPRIKITELLMAWTTGRASADFTHLKDGAEAKTGRCCCPQSSVMRSPRADQDGRVEPGLTYAKLSWLQAWHIRDETYSAALAELVNHQYRHAFAATGRRHDLILRWQRFRAGAGARAPHVNPKYGSEPGRLFYTHISDQYGRSAPAW